MSEVRSLIDAEGRALGAVVGPEMCDKLYRLVGMVLADALGSPTDFESRPTTYVKVSYRLGPTAVEFLYVTLDLAFHRVRLQLANERPEFLEPLSEPRFRLARKVEAFVARAAARRAAVEERGGEGSAFRPRRLESRECCSRCPGSCYVMEPVD